MGSALRVKSPRAVVRAGWPLVAASSSTSHPLLTDHADLPEPDEIAAEIVTQLQTARVTH